MLMKRMLVLAAIIASVLSYFSLTATYSRSSTHYKGWPIPYQEIKVADIQLSICRGVLPATPLGGCDNVLPSNNYFAVAGDIALCVAAGLLISFPASRFGKK
jgi:hypothetical protein